MDEVWRRLESEPLGLQHLISLVNVVNQEVGTDERGSTE
jgi:hypothetical protein